MKQNISQKKIVTDTVNFKPSKLRSRLTGGSASVPQFQGSQSSASPIGSLLEGLVKGFQGAQQTQRQQEEIELRREQIGLQKKEAEAKLRQQEIRNQLGADIEAPQQETATLPGVAPEQTAPGPMGFTGLSPELAMPGMETTTTKPAGMKERMIADLIRAGDTSKAFEMFQPKPISMSPGASLVDLAGGEPKEVYRSPEKRSPPLRGRAGDVFLDPNTGEPLHSIPEKNTEERIRVRAAEQRFPDDLDKQASYIKELKNSGSVGKAELAIRAVQGDANAKKALDLLNANERDLTVVDLSQRAAAGNVNAQLALKWLQFSRFSLRAPDTVPPGDGGRESPSPAGSPAARGQQGPSKFPDPRQVRPGEIFIDRQTGGRFKSDGRKWIPLPARER